MHTVLIIEDSKSLAQLIAEKIRVTSGFQVLIASSYEQAKGLLKTNADPFCAIVDINLPDAANGEAIDLVLACDVPVIVYTSSVDDALREKIITKGVSDYILKSANHSVDNIVSLVNRLYRNQDIKVLVVDDSASFRELMSNYLKRHCYKVVTARDGIEALDQLYRERDIKLALIDCYMDKMDGFELTKKIRQNHKQSEISIIGMSGKARGTDSAKLMKSGANDFILKPFIAEEFFCRVNLCIDQMENISALKAADSKKNHLIGMVAHDIRGPLGNIVAVANMMLKGDLPQSKTPKLLNMIVKSGEDMLAMVNELLDLSVVESGEFELKIGACDYVALVQDIVSFYHHAIQKKQIKLELSVPDFIACHVDQSRLKQVVNNLVSNAIKYSPEASTVKIIVDNDDENIIMHVYDEGEGIPPEEEPLLFKAFKKLSNKTTGGESSTGLGLAICKKIVEAHGGQIGYARNDDVGSDFFISLPLGLNHASSSRREVDTV